MARVALLEKEDVGIEFKDLFEKIIATGGEILNIHKIVAHCPAIGVKFLQMGNAVLRKSILPPNLRELAILRVGYLNRATYEITQHIPIGSRAGLTQMQIETVSAWQESSHFNRREQTLLQYTDEVSQNIRVTVETFKAVNTFFTSEQIVDLTLTIGYYGMVCRLLEALEVELENDK